MSAPTTFTTFLGNLGDLAISGVSIRMDYVPPSLADLPCQWVQLPTGDEAPLTFDGSGGWPTMRAQLVIAVVAAAQGTPSQNWAATVAIMDAALTTMRAVAIGALGQGKPTWTIRGPLTVTVNETDYWGAIVDVTAYG